MNRRRHIKNYQAYQYKEADKRILKAILYAYHIMWLTGIYPHGKLGNSQFKRYQII